MAENGAHRGRVMHSCVVIGPRERYFDITSKR